MLKRVESNAADDKLQRVLNRLEAGGGTVCYDAETSGLDFKRCHIVGHVLTFGPAPQDTYYVPVRHAAGGNIGNNPGPQDKHGWDRKPLAAETELMRRLDRARLTFGHNYGFDLKFMEGVGFQMEPRCEDTQVNATLIDEWQGKFSLDFCSKIAGVEAKKVEIIRDHIKGLFPDAGDRDYMGHYWRLAGNDPTAVEYAEGDGTTTWQLRDWQMKQVADQQLDLVHDVESRLVPILARMSVRGIKIDEERLSWLEDYLKQQIGKLLEQFPADFNARSPQDVEKWCRDHGRTDWPLTQHKINPRPSFNEAWLETHEPGQQIVAVRKLSTLRDTFVNPMREIHLFNGRVHTTFNQLRGDGFGTITGRLSSSDPNLQAVPKHNETIGRLFRSIFVPDEGRIWGAVDFSQMEPRLLAYYSRCKVLLDDYRNNPKADAHTAVAKAINLDWDAMERSTQKTQRDRGKRVNQTLITGGGAGVLRTKYKIDDAEALMRDYFRRMPEIKQLQNKSSNVFKRRGYVRSLLGRKARLLSPDKAFTAVNRLLQCGNADVIKLKMVECDDYLKSEGYPIDILNNVHDALDFSFAEGERRHYERCKEIMVACGEGDVIELDVPLTLDAGEGKDWAVATYGPEK